MIDPYMPATDPTMPWPVQWEAFGGPHPTEPPEDWPPGLAPVGPWRFAIVNSHGSAATRPLCWVAEA